MPAIHAGNVLLPRARPARRSRRSRRRSATRRGHRRRFPGPCWSAAAGSRRPTVRGSKFVGRPSFISKASMAFAWRSRTMTPRCGSLGIEGDVLGVAGLLGGVAFGKEAVDLGRRRRRRAARLSCTRRAAQSCRHRSPGKRSRRRSCRCRRSRRSACSRELTSRPPRNSSGPSGEPPPAIAKLSIRWTVRSSGAPAAPVADERARPTAQSPAESSHAARRALARRAEALPSASRRRARRASPSSRRQAPRRRRW